MRQGFSKSTQDKILNSLQDKSKNLENRIALLYAYSQAGVNSKFPAEIINKLSQINDPALEPYIVRALGDMAIDLRTAQKASPLNDSFLASKLKSANPNTILEAIICTARQEKRSLASEIIPHLASKDPIIFHTAFQALAMLNAYPETLKALHADATRKGASFALMRMHDPKLVDQLVAQLTQEKNSKTQMAMISVLTRLYHKEAQWQGDSWSTRPDTRGPYYQLALWEKSEIILNALNTLWNHLQSPKALTTEIVSQLGKNRVQNDRGLNQIIKLAQNDSSLLPTVLGQLADKENVPAQAIPLILSAASNPKTRGTSLQQSVNLLMKFDHPQVYPSLMKALDSLLKDHKASKVRSDTRKQLFNSPKLENYTDQFIKTAKTELNTRNELWAFQALLHLASAKGIGKEAQSKSKKVIDELWAQDKKKANLIQAAHRSRNPYLNDRIATVANHSDKAIKAWAEAAVRSLRIQLPEKIKLRRSIASKPNRP